MRAPYSRTLAVAYLVSLPALAIGLGFLAISGSSWAATLAILGGPALVLLACALSRSDADRYLSYRVQWYRLALGAEAPRAWRIARGTDPVVDARYRR